MIGDKSNLIWQPSVTNYSLSFFLGLLFFDITNPVQIVPQILDSLMQLSFDLIIFPNIIRYSIILLNI